MVAIPRRLRVRQLAAEGNMLRARMQVRKRERVARIKGALTDWGKSDKKKRKGEPEEDYGLPPGIDLDFLRSDRFEDNVEREKRSQVPPTRPRVVLIHDSPATLLLRLLAPQYEAFDRYYKSKQGVGVGTWGAFGGSGVVIPAQRLLWEGESGVPYQELGPAPVKPQGDGLDHPDHVFDLAFGDSLSTWLGRG